ncbi:MAG TPA: hypothetical protein VE199_03570 [Nitrososphaera sp.]|nr:hypothetical protein [Nitrososphaera sp.]
MASEANDVAKIVDSIHDFIGSKKVNADIAIISLVSAAAEIALSIIAAQPELKDAYLKVFDSSIEQVRKQLEQELKERKI